MSPHFLRNRREAGQLLARRLSSYVDDHGVIVLALPRGGVPVAYEVARALHAPLDVFIVRKLGVPGHEELAMGAVASGGVRVVNDHVVMGLRIPGEAIDRVAARELQELDRREHAYRGGRPLPDLAKRTVILVDDGLATGTTMQAALMALRNLRPARIVVAVPVASEDACERIRGLADEVVCMATPEPFHAVGIWYADFTQTTDDEVRELLADAQQDERSSSSWPTQGSSHASH
jgi:predicted phosphoribosyltransferase